MTEQLTLDAPRIGTRDRVAPDDARIGLLVDFLRGKGWVVRRSVCEALGWEDRLMRQIKSQAGGLIISSSGHHGVGYKLISEATIPEIDHAVGERQSRIRKLQQEIIDIERVKHSGSGLLSK